MSKEIDTFLCALRRSTEAADKLLAGSLSLTWDEQKYGLPLAQAIFDLSIKGNVCEIERAKDKVYADLGKTADKILAGRCRCDRLRGYEIRIYGNDHFLLYRAYVRDEE